MGQKMRNAPVYFTVAQVRFNPILKLESYLSTIQDRMRGLRFSDYKNETIQHVMMQFGSIAGAGLPQPAFQSQARCIFGNLEGTTSFVLESGSLALQTTAYDTFETFSETLFKGLAIVHEAIKLDFTERVGLRYLDAVMPQEGEPLTDYLIEEVLGLSHKLDGKFGHSFSETLTLTNTGKLVSRVIVQEGQVGLPPEMMMLTPMLDARFTQFSGRHAILDTDAAQEQREAFDLQKLKSTMSQLHDDILKSFKATVTPHAIKTWK